MHRNLINRLPDELLSPIFVMAVHGANAWPRDRAGVSRARALATISSTCHLWRSISLITPQLWCSIAFRPKSSWAAPSLILNLRLWLERSGTVPLNLYLDFRTHCISRHDRDIVELSVRPHLPRVQELVVCSPGKISHVSRERLIPAGDSIKLKKLERILSNSSHIGPFPSPNRLESFTLRLGDTSVDEDYLMRCTIPGHLVELDLDRCFIHPQELANFLFKCTPLQALKIKGSGLLASPHITLESLRYLEIGWIGRIPQVIVSIPNLTHVKFRQYRTPIEGLPRMPKLLIFTIVMLRSSLHLSELPQTIVDLRIYGTDPRCPVSTVVAQLLQPSSDPAIPLPHLANLRIRMRIDNNLEQSQLSSLLPSLLIARPLLHLHLMIAPVGVPSLLDGFRAELLNTFGERIDCDDAGPPDLRRWFSGVE